MICDTPEQTSERQRQRTLAIYEDFAGCPVPPLIPLPKLTDSESLQSIGVPDGPLARAILTTAFSLSGFRKFYRELPKTMETILNFTNRRSGYGGGPNMSVTFALADDPRPVAPLVRAAALLKSVWELHSDIRAGRFTADIINDQPLEMRQYLNLFATSVTYDEHLGFHLFKSTDMSHVAVLAAGKFYILDLGCFTTISSSQIASALETTWATSKQSDNQSNDCDTQAAAGLISNASSTTQKGILGDLLKTATNAQSLNALRHTFVTLCLDLDHQPRSYAEALKFANVGNPANRWFHSSLQIVVFGNSRACFITNFSAYIDGNVAIRAGAELHRRAINYGAPPLSEPQRMGKIHVEPLRWSIPRGPIETAYADFAKIRDDQECTFELEGCGRSSFYSRGLKPIPTFIAALQLALFRIVGHPIRMGEMIARSGYRFMGAGGASVTTPAMREFVYAWGKPGQDPVYLRDLALAAIASHSEACRRARSNMPLPEVIDLFQDGLSGRRRQYVEYIMRATRFSLKLLRLFDPQPFDEVIVSHPTTRSEIPIMGRPGVRLPYIHGFGLHYQIHNDSITLTFMPSTTWKVRNEAIVSEVKLQIRALLDLFPRQVYDGERGP